jgi:hypothetical protein
MTTYNSLTRHHIIRLAFTTRLGLYLLLKARRTLWPCPKNLAEAHLASLKPSKLGLVLYRLMTDTR